MKLPISEVFYSIQGEGKTCGVPSVFVRLGGCNLMCGGMGTQFDGELHNGAKWRCDTLEVWTRAKLKPVEEILGEEEITAIKNGAHIIITGGEPLMQQKGIEAFINYVKEEIYSKAYFEIETNGTIQPNNFLFYNIDLWNCSPKLSNSGNEKELAYKPEVLSALNEHNSIFKFVINDEEDWSEVVELYFPIVERRKIYLMPAGENQELLKVNSERVAELAKKEYLKYTSRLHIDIWNKKTGV